jgi:hypothetical protein
VRGDTGKPGSRQSPVGTGALRAFAGGFFGAEKNGAIELVIELKNRDLGLHTYYAPLHPRDIEHSQFPWTLQRYLYDCLHDYLVEMFIRTPQSRNA